MRNYAADTLLESLVSLACSRNIDFKIGHQFFNKLLNINSIYSELKFMPFSRLQVFYKRRLSRRAMAPS